jgi:MFS family permease
MQTLTANRTIAARQSQPRLVWTLVLASLGVFMAALDTLVVTTALPVLRLDLHASLGDLEWTVNAFNLALACLLLTAAALGDRFGRRRMYVVGLAIFTAASAAALAPGIGALIAARAVQGAGAAIVLPLSLTLITAAFPPERRSMAIGLWGGITGLAVAAGPVVGGAVVNGLSWHWIFWLNVPIGLVLIPVTSKNPDVRRRAGCSHGECHRPGPGSAQAPARARVPRARDTAAPYGRRSL